MSVVAEASRAGPAADVEKHLRPLIIRTLGGDDAANRQLLRALGSHLRSYFGRRIGPGASEIEDLVQETLLAVHLKRDSYDPTLPFTPWAYAFARYKLIDHLRRRHRPVHVPLDAAGTLFAGNDAEEDALHTDLHRMLERLPDRQRSLLEGVKFQGLSIKEAAEKRGVTAASARVMLHRILKSLHHAWHDETA